LLGRSAASSFASLRTALAALVRRSPPLRAGSANPLVYFFSGSNPDVSTHETGGERGIRTGFRPLVGSASYGFRGKSCPRRSPGIPIAVTGAVTGTSSLSRGFASHTAPASLVVKFTSGPLQDARRIPGAAVSIKPPPRIRPRAVPMTFRCSAWTPGPPPRRQSHAALLQWHA